MAIDETGRCYKVGGAVENVRCQVDAAINAKDEHAFKGALFQISKSGKAAAGMLPDAKEIANTIAHRGRMLLKIATDLHGTAQKHARFFEDQLSPLRGYAQELENRAMISCLGYQYPSHDLEPLPAISKTVKKAAEQSRKRYNADLLKRHQKWLKKMKVK
jgi:hypothetical protein